MVSNIASRRQIFPVDTMLYEVCGSIVLLYNNLNVSDGDSNELRNKTADCSSILL